MSNRLKIKKGDQVIVISGNDKGKKGKVIASFPKEGKIIVEGVNMVKKHKKPRQQGDPAGIIQQEAPIYAHKVMHICGKCKKPTRVGYDILASGDKVRVCKKCNETLTD